MSEGAEFIFKIGGAIFTAILGVFGYFIHKNDESIKNVEERSSKRHEEAKQLIRDEEARRKEQIIEMQRSHETMAAHLASLIQAQGETLSRNLSELRADIRAYFAKVKD